MKLRHPARALALVLTLAAAAPAGATEYTRVEPKQSSVRFSYSQMGVAVDGGFSRFVANLAFDPARPAAAKLDFSVDLASVDTGSEEGDGMAGDADWFDTGRFPKARFVSRSVRALGENRFEVRGVLTLKGKSREMAVPVSVQPGAKSAVFAAEFSLNRLDFGIGSGPWADTGTVANPVRVKVRLTATGT